MNEEHTQGPWVYSEQTKTIRSKKENYWLATMDSWDGSVNNAANARLISAAPDLLAACDEMLRTLVSPSRQLLESTRKELAPWLPMLRAAVAKAKGETE
jgi:hypothetical protein